MAQKASFGFFLYSLLIVHKSVNSIVHSVWEALGLSGEVGVEYVTRYCYFMSSSSPLTGYAQEEQLKEEEEIKEEEEEEEDSGSGAQPQGSNDAGTDEELETGPEQLLFNMLSRLVIVFLPRTKSLLYVGLAKIFVPVFPYYLTE